MNPFAPKTRVTVNLREQDVIADAQANRDGARVELIVELWDSQGRRLDWTLSRQEISVIARAAQHANEAALAKLCEIALEGGNMTARVYDPLPPDHPLVGTEEHRCAICHELFKAGDRTTLIPVDPSGEGGTVPALPAHAQCVQDLAESPPESSS